MEEELKQYIITTKEFKKSILFHMEINPKGYLELRENEAWGICILEPVDAIKEDETWNGLFAETQLSKDCTVTIYAAAINSPQKNIFMSHLKDEASSIEAKIAYMKEHLTEITSNPYGLLHSLKGRYLFLMLEIKSAVWSKQIIRYIRVEFPFYSISRYLPEIYQGNEFFERFLAIFQTVYLEMEREIDHLPKGMNVSSVKKEQLRELALWLGIDAREDVWKEGQLRVLVKNAMHFRKMKGTIKGIREAVKLYSSVYPVIVEYFELLVIENETMRKDYEKVFTKNPYQFCVIMPVNSIKTDKEYERLLEIIGSVKPMQTEVNLVVLDEEINLDLHSYIGINTYLSKAQPLQLDAKARLGNLIELT